MREWPHIAYRLLGQTGEVLYVGFTYDIHQRLTGHVQQKRIPAPYAVVLEYFATEREALCREAHLIADLKPTYNRRQEGIEYLYPTRWPDPRPIRTEGPLRVILDTWNEGTSASWTITQEKVALA